MLLNIHSSIIEKLYYFHKIHKIPNIIFHGGYGTGKKTIVNDFIRKIYDDNKAKIKDFVMYVNCAHGKGIKFIREELKFFAKTHINSNGGDIFKSIILLNADKLTMDGQSALRRCIELFSHTTRFFIIIEDKYKLLKPILSRFCEIYVPDPVYENKTINLYKYTLSKTLKLQDVKKKQLDWLQKELLTTITPQITHNELLCFTSKLYEKGYHAMHLMELLENNKIPDINDKKKYELLIAFNRVRKEIRNEKLLMLFILNFVYVDPIYALGNISFL
uniref:Replication factor C small subunit n=1 Tax=viral metagenome TaxID=1070528 RepID=A0A6C0E1D7_9ZZZZ